MLLINGIFTFIWWVGSVVVSFVSWIVLIGWPVIIGGIIVATPLYFLNNGKKNAWRNLKLRMKENPPLRNKFNLRLAMENSKVRWLKWFAPSPKKVKQ